MSDFTAVPYESRSVPAQLASSWAADAKAFARGTLFTAAITIVGTIAVVVALMVGVVGAPVIAAAVAYAVFRQRRTARVRPSATWRSAEG